MQNADAGLPYGLIEMLLVFGVVLAFAIWEFVSVRRSMRADEAARRKEAREGPQREADPPSSG